MQLTDRLEKYFRLVESQKKALTKLGISTVEDLMYYFPVRYGDSSQVTSVSSLSKGDTVTIFGKISGLKTSKAFIKRFLCQKEL